MQRCWNCDTEQMDGTIFCAECGASLIGRQRRQETTTTLDEPEPFEAHDSSPVAVASDSTPGVSLVLISDGRRVHLESNKTLLVGRTDQKRGIIPDIDLGIYGGYDAGVSRRHAMIAVEESTCTVEDLDSANGTFINGQRIHPHQPMPLHNGDELKFGTLPLRIEISPD